MTEKYEDLINRLREPIMYGGDDTAKTNKANFDRKDAADEIENLLKLLSFALEGLNQVPHSWGLDITHIEKIEEGLKK